MTPRMFDLVKALASQDGSRGPVLEIGSLVESEQDHLDLRQLFPGQRYVGLDVVDGPGVDARGSLLDAAGLVQIAVDLKPRFILCLYVLEHVWRIREAVDALAQAWTNNPVESWLVVATHQNQPYHGHLPLYDDFWRLTARGLRCLMDDVKIPGGIVFVHQSSTNPEDVVFIRPPLSTDWFGEGVGRPWEIY